MDLHVVYNFFYIYYWQKGICVQALNKAVQGKNNQFKLHIQRNTVSSKIKSVSSQAENCMMGNSEMFQSPDVNKSQAFFNGIYLHWEFVLLFAKNFVTCHML